MYRLLIKTRILPVICLLMLHSMLYAYEPVIIHQQGLKVDLSEFADYQQFHENNQTLSEVLSPSVFRQFAPIHGNGLKFNQLKHGSWILFSINNPMDQKIRLFLTIDTPFLEEAELYYNINQDQFFSSVSTGNGIAFRKRPYELKNLVLPMDITPGEQILLLKLTPYHASNVNIRLLDEKTMLHQALKEIIINIFVLSLLCVAICILLFGLYRYQTTTMLWSTTLVFGMTLNLIGWNGSIAWLLPTIPCIELICNHMGAFLSFAAFMQLISQMHLERIPKHLATVLKWASFLLLSLIMLSLFPLNNLLFTLQKIIMPLFAGIILYYWFMHPPITQSERIMLVGSISLSLYYCLSFLLLIGLISSFPLIVWIMSILTIICCALIVYVTYIKGKSKSTTMNMDNLKLPKIPWSLLRKLNHEIRGPINGILGMTELIQDTTLSAHQQEFVNSIQTAGFALLREMDQLQNLIRIGLNRPPNHEDQFDLHDLIEDTIQPFTRIAHSQQLELILDISPDLPSNFKGNSLIISQVLSTLLDNALKFTTHGEVMLQIKDWQNQKLRFSVTDTGPGITKDSRSGLFQFPDNGNDNLQPKDIHLGLPICKYLINALGGQISVQSELKKGTTFWFDLPLKKIQSMTSQSEKPTSLTIADLRIMVVDDNMSSRKVIEHLATSWRAQVLGMTNGQSAMANLHNQYHKDEPIDLLILDQKMPTMSGIEMARRIRKDDRLNKDIVMVIMSGSDDVSGELQNNNTVIEFILSKPITSRSLKNTILQAIPKIIVNRNKKNDEKFISY